MWMDGQMDTVKLTCDILQHFIVNNPETESYKFVLQYSTIFMS
jgi:hypothetical protein